MEKTKIIEKGGKVFVELSAEAINRLGIKPGDEVLVKTGKKGFQVFPCSKDLEDTLSDLEDTKKRFGGALSELAK